jgi:predicted small lipoprotein YifL
VIVVIKRLVVAAAAAAVLATASGCGREGSVALPDSVRFCALANDLAARAAARLGPLGPTPPLTKLANALDEFIKSIAKEYEDLDRVALPYLREALARQRAAQRAFIGAQTDEERFTAYGVLARSGQQVVLDEKRVCG